MENLENKISRIFDKSESVTAKDYFMLEKELISLTTNVAINFSDFLIEIQSLDEYKKHSVSELFKKFVEERLK